MEKLSILELFNYQKIGAQWLAEKRFALLADRQRLGKTIQSIRAADIVQASRILVVCRAVARAQWSAEFMRWQKIERSIRIVEPKIRYEKHLNPPPSSVTITSYESLVKVMAGLQGSFDLVIIDESHYLKNPTAKRTQEILGNKGLLHRTERLWMLSGTPAPNHAGELWTMLYTFGATKIKYMEFIRRFCVTYDGGYGLQITGTKTAPAIIDELRELLAPVMLRREEKDVDIEMPKLHFSSQIVEPGRVDIEESGLFRKELSMYGRTEVLKLIEQEFGVYNAIVENTASHELIETLKAQSKSISTLRRYTALQKIDALAELITEELREKAYSKVVVFCIHVAAVEILMKRLREFHPVSVVGGTTNAAANIAAFQDPTNKCKVFIGNINAAGTSISLSVANHIYFLEEDWTPGNNMQATMRCGGINQLKGTIFVRTIVLNNSVDWKVTETLKRKTEELAQIFNTETTIEELLV